MPLRSWLLTSGALLTIAAPAASIAQTVDTNVPPAGTAPAPAPSITPPQSTAVQPPLDDQAAADIIVTGSLIRGQGEDSALPVDVITAGELQRQGSPSVVELLKALPVANGNSLTTGVLEGSNVDAAGALVQMIQLQRQFEMQVKVIRSGDEMAQSSNQLLRLGG